VNHPDVRKADKEAAEKYGMGNPMGCKDDEWQHSQA